jgi:hypothetical protein
MISKPKKLSRLTAAFGLALAASLAVGALAAGSASALSVSPADSRFTLQSGTMEFRSASGSVYECTSSAGLGRFTDGVNGWTEAELKGCKMKNTAIPCTSAGKESGTVSLGKMNIKLVYLDAAKTKYGLMLTPQSPNSFAEMTCWGFNVKFTGSLIGEFKSPALNVSTKNATLAFAEAAAGKQAYQQIEGAGTLYHLTQSVGGGTPSEIGVSGSEAFSFLASATFLP